MKMFYFFGREAKYSTFTWWESFMGGHITIGKRITIFGENAMHWAIKIRTKKFGVIVFTLPVRTFGKYFGCHIYFSPNGTPWASTYYKSLWKESNRSEEIRSRIRKLNFGHNFDTKEHDRELMALNEKFDSLIISAYDVLKHESVAYEVEY